MSDARRKVVGMSEVVRETILKETRTKNTLTQTIKKTVVNAIELECGHKIPVTRFNKVPKNNTRCIMCEQLMNKQTKPKPP